MQDDSAHAATQTDPTLGEACAVCHGPDGAFSVDSVHAITE
jgi:mono/diheme cytochrome c family protein